MNYLFDFVKQLFTVLSGSSVLVKSLFKIVSGTVIQAKETVKSDFRNVKRVLTGKEKASYNNYIIGREMLKKNELLDAKFRFMLADKFYGKSAIIKYYRAYVYYLRGKYKKSLFYIKESIRLRPKMKESSILLEKIEKAIEQEGHFSTKKKK